MPKPKTISSTSLLKKQMQNDKFKKEYDLLEEEFELAREIIQLRIKASLTQKQLAELAGTSQPAIARLESGSYKNVSLAFLRRVGKALNATPEIHFRKNKC
ncbi:MAG TPA: helix-turn-helix transcriptional regulator [Spirochaetota bacterium]|nr:helix-turn-helix transcriptional regulator [Spirochaetota bacterium]HQE60428.1 helix-turn-helix transcriptional regulator [Spirochaetota bacterium]